MKKGIVGLFICLITFLVIGYLMINQEDKTILKNTKMATKQNNSMLSLMLETSEGSGEYSPSTNGTWPQEGYTYNERLSKCENGSELIWDNTAKTVKFNGSVSDKCYVYFDKVPEIVNFANYIKGLHTADGANGIYLHDGVGTYGTSEAGDDSYRYSGANPSNYVCFGSNVDPCPIEDLYRIIGVFDDRVKLIKADYATPEQLGQGEYFIDIYDTYGNFEYYKGSIYDAGIYSFNYNDSPNMRYIYGENLNYNYTDYLSLGEKNWGEYISTIMWEFGYAEWTSMAETVGVKNIYDVEKTQLGDSCPSKIGLMYVSDYLYAADPTKGNSWSSLMGFNSDATKDFRAVRENNWMYMGLPESTINIGVNNESNEIVFNIDDLGSISNNMISVEGAIRPSFILKPNVELIDGDGTSDKPYRLEHTPSIITFTINSTSYQAEEGMTWLDWIYSSYNKDNYGENGVVYYDGAYRLYSNIEQTIEVLNSDSIINNHSYYHKTRSQGLGEPIAPRTGC